MRLIAILVLAGAVSIAKEAPSWVQEAARQTTKSDYPAKVNHVTLLAEEHLSLDAEGRRTMTERGVIKILQPGGSPPEAFRTYNPKSGRIRDFHAWLVYPSGRETEYDKKRVLDVALDQRYTYDEGRAKVIECDADAPAGSVFAYEVTEEEDTIFTTYHYGFQEKSPVVVSRFVLSLPAGWEARATVFNHDEIKPEIAGSTYTWEARDLPWIEEEENSPGWHAIAPRLAVTYFPGSAAKAELRPMKDWPAVSGWLAGFVDPPAAVTPAVRAKAQELTSSSKTELEKITAIAAFAQQTNYVSVQMNLTRGGGYTPHPADQVLSRNYGDCKDKATLMRALLQAVGIDAYPVIIYSGDREFVRREWPSPMQFNHAIVAVKVSPETNLPTVITDMPQLGRLLIFDPTDPVTRVGDLPAEEQGSYALVIAGPQGNLVKMPMLPATANRIELSVDAQMDAAGAVSAHLVTHYFGQSASPMRYMTQHGGPDELKRVLERSYSRRLGGVALDHIAPADQAQEGRLDLALDLNVRQFGQLMQNRLLVFKPGALAPDHGYNFPKKPRKLPVKLSARVRKDQVSLRLPPGFAVDEVPDPARIESPYGVYQTSWKAANDVLIFEASLETKDIIAPASDYDRVRDFFDKLAGGQYGAVVLVKR